MKSIGLRDEIPLDSFYSSPFMSQSPIVPFGHKLCRTHWGIFRDHHTRAYPERQPAIDGSEDEHQFELMICKERSWNPESFDEKCIAFTRDRAAHAASNPSFHLSWLGSKIPAYATLRIVAVQDALLGEYPYKRIVVMLDDAEVVFGYDPRQGPFGLLFILSIGGVNADELLEKDISAGYTPSVFLKRDTP